MLLLTALICTCSHSYGEFVFDYAWADAYYSYGSRYYPKFQCCVPFTPVTGPRILVRNSPLKEQVTDVIITALKDLTAKVQNRFKNVNIFACFSFSYPLPFMNILIVTFVDILPFKFLGRIR